MNTKRKPATVFRAQYPAVLVVIQLCCSFSGYAQQTETQGWFFLTHTQKLSKSFDVLFDAQTRTADKFDYASTLLLRTALSYNLNDAHSLALGYAYKGNREKTGEVYEYANENRIYEQYLYSFTLAKMEMILRGRVEQRWLKEEKTDFSQRARIFISAQIPLFTDTAFSKGMYAGIQNEVFLNVINKRKVNGRVFDQNRTFLSIGYRWNKAIDTEIGYMYWFQPEMDDSFRRNVIQLQLTTRF